MITLLAAVIALYAIFAWAPKKQRDCILEPLMEKWDRKCSICEEQVRAYEFGALKLVANEPGRPTTYILGHDYCLLDCAPHLLDGTIDYKRL